MIVVADSGSTKCDWVVIDPEGAIIAETSTMGLNPYFHAAEVIADTVSKDQKLIAVAKAIKQVFFYGAGSSNDTVRSIVENGLKRVFVNAEITVDHDLVGAALATYDGRPCISCILGTGSNSTYFDGKHITEEVPALAYIIGDEGSSSYYGKQLLRDFFYKRMPPEIAASFEAEYELTKDMVLHHVYREEHSNVYLASFARFMGKHLDNPYIDGLIEKGLEEFVDVHVMCYANCHDLPVHFIGSIAYYYEEILRRVCNSKSIEIGAVIQKPIHGLASYHAKVLTAKA